MKLDAQPTQCTFCNQTLPTDHTGLPLCRQCEYSVRQEKRFSDAEKLNKKPHPTQPGIREFNVRDLRIA